MTTDRFNRQMLLFGKEGQEKISAARVTVVGVGGLGTQVVQQLALLGVGTLKLIDSEDLADTDRNRYVGAWHNDPVPGSQKVQIGERLAHLIDPAIQVTTIHDSLVSDAAFAAVIESDYLFGCLDSEGARLISTELTAAYTRPYIDLASDVIPGDPPTNGGRVCVAQDGTGCLICCELLDVAEAHQDLRGPEAQREREALYGVDRAALERSGPSVVSMNGVVASLAVTEFMVAVTGLRPPQRVLKYYGHTGKVIVSQDAPAPDCYYCNAVRGKGEAADVQRYIREGVGRFLR